MTPCTRGQGLAPVSGTDPEILILGSYPSRLSLAKNEYYGNPRNQFWKIIELCLGIDSSLPYRERISFLAEKRIALWDVICSCSRTGSADSAIKRPVSNDIEGFIRSHPTVQHIVLNGTTAGRYFSKIQEIPVSVLPSTSTANARFSLKRKAELWAYALRGSQ